MTDELRTLASLTISSHPELYKVVDVLNRTLKDRGLLFGLALDSNDTMTVTIYDAEASSYSAD